jgi:hypothetical protein
MSSSSPSGVRVVGYNPNENDHKGYFQGQSVYSAPNVPTILQGHPFSQIPSSQGIPNAHEVMLAKAFAILIAKEQQNVNLSDLEKLLEVSKNLHSSEHEMRFLAMIDDDALMLANNKRSMFSSARHTLLTIACVSEVHYLEVKER